MYLGLFTLTVDNCHDNASHLLPNCFGLLYQKKKGIDNQSCTFIVSDAVHNGLFIDVKKWFKI